MSPESKLATKEAPGKAPIIFGDFNKLFEQMEDQIHKVMKRAYELFEQRGRSDGHALEDWLTAESELLQPVPVEIEDREKELVLRADVPGFKAEELNVAVEPSRILISGKSESKKEQKEKGKVVYSEQRSSEISRSLALPAEVLPDQANAVLKDGRLEVMLPKAQTKKSAEKKLLVKAA
jgi:HSP20 family protein